MFRQSGNLSISGQVMPRSQRETASGEVSAAAASASWLSPLPARSSESIFPNASARKVPTYDISVSSLPSSFSSDMPSAAASSPSCAMSGSDNPLSHLETVCG